MLLKITLSSEYPLWLAVFCLALGIGLSYLIYQRRESNKELNKTLLLILFSIRAAYLSIIAFLIISPFVLSLEPVYEKPILIFAQDRSQSIEHLNDSSELNAIINAEQQFVKQCEDDFDVQILNFGEEVSSGGINAAFDQRITDYSSLFDEVKDRFENRNVALMVMGSDGLYNRGQNPLYSTDFLPFPLYTLAMGDTSSQLDVYVEDIDHNELAFYGNTFDIDVKVGAQLLNGSKTKLNVFKNGQKLSTQEVNISSSNFVETYKVSLQADEVGTNRYEVAVETVGNESTISNNSRHFYIEVLEGQQEILILSSAPHPDVNALMQAINKSKHFNAESKLISDFNGNLDKYNLLILNQLPSDKRGAKTIDLNKLDMPALIIVGTKTSLNEFNQMDLGLKFERFKRQYNEVTASVNSNFRIFSISDELSSIMEEFPPLKSPFADYVLSGTMNTFSYQKIGKVVTEYPQIGFMEGGKEKRAFILGEGIWRWRLQDYKLNQSTEIFDNFVQSMIQYLGLKEDKSRFRIEVEASFFEDQEVLVQAEYYNKAYELSNEHEASLILRNSEGKTFEYDFLAFNDKYRANIGRLESGDYTWKASLNDGVESFEKNGSFSIKELQLEYGAVKADYPYLVNLSNKFGGKVLHHSDLNKLAEEILADEKYKPTVHYTKTMKELISFKWLFVILLLLLSAEWFIRKWFGLI